MTAGPHSVSGLSWARCVSMAVGSSLLVMLLLPHVAGIVVSDQPKDGRSVWPILNVPS